jgi:hypothetical protein
MADGQDQVEDDPGELLARALDTITAPDVNERAFNELMYTASERGLLEFRITLDDAKKIFQMLILAKGFQGPCPEKYRM